MCGSDYIKNTSSMLKSILFCVSLIASVSVYGQSDKKFIRKGNREYEKNKYSESEISYRKATDQNKQSPDAVFNTGDALYKQNKFEDAGKQFIESTNQNVDKLKRSDGFYNLGNSLLKANKFQESIGAYENSLKLHPENPEAKYNLSYAMDQLKKQQQQQQNKQGKDKQDNKDNEKNKNKDQNKDQKDQNEKNKEQQDQKNDQNKNQNQQQQNQQISKEDAQRLLNSLASDEKNVEEKVKLAKAAKSKVRTVDNW